MLVTNTVVLPYKTSYSVMLHHFYLTTLRRDSKDLFNVKTINTCSCVHANERRTTILTALQWPLHYHILRPQSKQQVHGVRYNVYVTIQGYTFRFLGWDREVLQENETWYKINAFLIVIMVYQ